MIIQEEATAMDVEENSYILTDDMENEADAYLSLSLYPDIQSLTLDSPPRITINPNLNLNPNPYLIGFCYNTNYSSHLIAVVPPPISRPPPPPCFRTFKGGEKIRHTGGDCAQVALCSSGGLLLQYYSSFCQTGGSESFFFLSNPTAGPDQHTVLPGPPPLTTGYCVSSGCHKRFLVYGFAVLEENLVVLEVTDVGKPGCLLVNQYQSVHNTWRRKVYDLGDDYVLFGSSTFVNGSFHWLLEPSGIIAYDITTGQFSLSLMDMPGDRLHLEKFGKCKCNRMMRAISPKPIRRPICNCRYLGESHGRLTYARVTGDTELTIWTLEDYHQAVWSKTITISEMRLRKNRSLYHGGVVAFERTDPRIVYLRLKRGIYSYNQVTSKIQRVHLMKKSYCCDYNYHGVVIPYELPSFDNTALARVLRGLPRPTLRTIRSSESGVESKQPSITFYSHNAITQLASKLSLEITGTNSDQEVPCRGMVYLTGTQTPANFIDATFRYADLVRLEAALYGCLSLVLIEVHSSIIRAVDNKRLNEILEAIYTALCGALNWWQMLKIELHE